MRKSLCDLVDESIVFEYNLPNTEHGIEHSKFSTVMDNCFSAKMDSKISEIIYNGIVEYALNEFDINYDDINTEHLRAMAENMRYNNDASTTTKIRYGFYGEVLLYAILCTKFDTDVLISKGYFFDPLEGGEAKGYDAYHLIQRNDKVELWFGEAKFRNAFKTSIDEIVKGFEKVLSEKYFQKNILAISKKKHAISHGTSIVDKLKPITETWRENVSIVISDELAKNNITLVYPVFIAYQKKNTKTFHENIKECIDYINTLFDTNTHKFPNTLSAKIFFIFLPVDDVKEIKETVVEWISTKRPLI